MNRPWRVCFYDCLRPGVLSSSSVSISLEDRPVKHALRDQNQWQLLTPKAIMASPVEQAAKTHALARAKLRAARNWPAEDADLTKLVAALEKAGCENVVFGCCRVDPGASRPHPRSCCPNCRRWRHRRSIAMAAPRLGEIADVMKAIHDWGPSGKQRRAAAKSPRSRPPWFYWLQPAAAMPFYTQMRPPPILRATIRRARIGMRPIPEATDGRDPDDAADEPARPGRPVRRRPRHSAEFTVEAGHEQGAAANRSRRRRNPDHRGRGGRPDAKWIKQAKCSVARQSGRSIATTRRTATKRRTCGNPIRRKPRPTARRRRRSEATWVRLSVRRRSPADRAESLSLNAGNRRRPSSSGPSLSDDGEELGLDAEPTSGRP